MIEIGSEAPDFRLDSDDDDSVSLRDFRGMWVVLYFYPKDNTSGCTTEAREFSEHVPDFEAMKVLVLGISPDTAASHKKFREKQKLSVKLLSDPERKVLKAYGAWGLKKSYGKEYEGVVRSTVVIDPEGIVRKVWPKVKAAGHAKEVLDILKGLSNV